MLGLGIIIGIWIGVAIGCAMGGHIAYEEGIMDERRKWYIHAERHFYKEEDFKEGEEDDD